MAYAGLPEGATVYEGLPEGAQIVPTAVVTPGPTESVAEELDKANGRYSPAMLRGAIESKGIIPRVITDNLPSPAAVSQFIRPTVEAGGAIAGGMIGLPLAPVSMGLAPVAGTALGYGIGKNIMDTADELIGVKPSRSLLQRITDTGGDLATGATMEMGGQVLGRGIGYGIDKLRAPLPFTQRATQAKAAQAFQETYAPPVSTELNPAGADIAAANAARQKETDVLLKRINATETPTPAQASGDVQAAFTEQSLAAKDPALAEALKYKDAALNQSAVNNLTGALGRGAELPAATPAQATGENITGSIKAALAPVQQAERELWAKVPEYPMPHDNFISAGGTLAGTPMVKSAHTAVDGILTYAEQVPKTVQGLQSIERTINSEISKAARAGDNETKRALTILKDSIAADFEAMGAAAQTGDVALHQGQIVIPGKIQAEIADLTKQVDMAAAQGATLKEQNAATAKYLASKGERPQMQNLGITEEQYARTLQGQMEYIQRSGVDITDFKPATSGANQQVTENLQRGIASREAILADLQPADDVAAAYNAAKQFSKEQKFDRFHKGAVDGVLKPGDQADGLRLTAESVSAKFFTPTGANDLIRAVGKEEAARQMTPHATELLTSKAVTADGTMDIPRAMAWVRQNKPALDNLGITAQMHETVKGQVPQAIRAQLDAKGIDVLGNPVMGAREAAKFVKQYAPAMQQLYGNSSKEVLAMQDYSKMLEILSRNKNVSYSGGSTSIEKLLATAPVGSLARRIVDNLTTTLMGSGVGLATGGPVGAVMGGAVGAGVKSALNTAKAYQQEMAGKIINEAITNPEAAKILMELGKGRNVRPAEMNRLIQTITGYTLAPAGGQK